MKNIASLGLALLALTFSVKGDITIQATGVNVIKPTGTWNGCPGTDYAWVATFIKPISSGWGWKEDTNSSTFTATDTNRTDTRVQFQLKNGTVGCAQTVVSVPTSTNACRFTIAGTNAPASSNLVLHGFNP